MSTAFQRGIVLYQQGRHDLADREFRRALAEDPDNPSAHAFLALCLTDQDRHDEALHEAGEAVRLDPDMALCHYVRGRALLDLDRPREAEAAALEAIRLDPDDADYPGLLAAVELSRGRWPAALEAAERGLALDPENAWCANLRAMALVQLGRRDEAAGTLGSALERDPENALTHANQGWALLHRGDHEGALVHFREALRIDPELEWARAGIVEALKARYLVYRLMLRFALWMGRQSTAAQWIILLAFVFGRKALTNIARANPTLAPFIWPVLVLTFAFLVLTWIASPLFDLLLRFNRFGRLALSREQRTASSWIGGCFLLAVSCSLAYVLARSTVGFAGMVYFGLLLMPLSATFGQEHRNPRRLMAAYTAVVAALGLPIMSLLVLGEASPWKDVKAAAALIPYFIGGAALSTWISAFLGSRHAMR
jgi:tetratricopeptide (TPR) repeat protein